MDSFHKSFLREYKSLVDNSQNENKALVDKITSKGKDFVSSIYRTVNEFIHALFETMIAMYDPNQEGFLEELERDLDKMVLTKTVDSEVYFVLIVLSRI